METKQVVRKDILDTAIAQGNFKTLEKALKASDLVGTLKGKGPFTVFAPTDEAFAKLPKEKLAELLKPENKAKLAGILKHHVCAGAHLAAELTKNKTIKTLHGGDLAIVSEAGKVRVGNAHVTKADVECSNGVIHVIDTVEMPK